MNPYSSDHRLLKRVISRTMMATLTSLVFFGAAPSIMAQSTNYLLEPAWVVQPMTPYTWVSTNDTHRGLAYNPVTGNLLTTSRFPGTNAAVYILNSTNGTLKGNLSVAGVKLDMDFPLNVIGVADDGVIYACNLTFNSSLSPVQILNSGPFRIYRWQNEGSAPSLVYEGDPSDNDLLIANKRFGDSIAVRGSGVNTEILCGTQQGDFVALFRTANGVNFTHLKVSAPLSSSTAGNMNTIAWGEGDTFYTKTDFPTAGGQLPLRHFSLNTSSATATLLENQLSLAARLGGPIGFERERNLLAIIKPHIVSGYSTHQLRLFKKTALGLDQQDVLTPFRAFPAMNANGNGTGAIAFGGGKLFALESNNGIMAFNIKDSKLVTQIIWAEDGGFSGPPGLGSIWKVNADGSGKTALATDLNRPIGVDVDAANGYVYSAEDGLTDAVPRSQIVRAKLDGSERTVLFSEAVNGFTDAQMLKLDVAHGHVYWIDYFIGVIRGNLNGTGYTVLGGDVNAMKYTAIDLDLANGHIYYNDPTQRGVLFRMDFSGSNRVELARNVAADNYHFNVISLDVANNNIYYTDVASGEIKRMNLDGANQTPILVDGFSQPFGVGHGPGNTLYWIVRAQRMASANIDGSNPNFNIVDIGNTPFGIAVYSVPPALVITGISIAGSVVTITWDGGIGPFQLQRRANLTTGVWENVGASTPLRQATDTIGALQMFYRIKE